MSHYAPIHLGHERDGERLGGTQCDNDELLRLIADGQSPERRDRDLGDGADIGARFTSDDYLVLHGYGFLSCLASQQIVRWGCNACRIHPDAKTVKCSFFLLLPEQVPRKASDLTKGETCEPYKVNDIEVKGVCRIRAFLEEAMLRKVAC